MKSHRAAVIQALFVVFLWATSWILIKVGLREMPPLTFAGLRYALAFICLLTVLSFNRARGGLRTLSRRAWARLLLLGLLYYAATQGASFVALSLLPAVTVNLVWSFTSVAVALLGVAFLSERPTALQWGGVLLAALGALIYFHPVEIRQSQVLGVAAAIGGVLANALSSILGRHINRSGEFRPLTVTVVSMGAGSIALLAAGVAVEGMPVIGFQGWLIIAWLAVVNTAFAFTLWNHTLRTLTAMESSIINGTMIIWIPLFAVAFLGERITGKEILGLVAVGAGTLIVQLRRVRRRPGDRRARPAPRSTRQVR